MDTIAPKGLVPSQLKAANIPIDYWTCDFASFRGPEKAADITKKYLVSLDSMKEKGIGLNYVGPNGPGKTTLAMIAMKYLVRANWVVHCTSLGEIVENIQKTWKQNEPDSAEQSAIRNCRESDFLYIDDVGKEHRGQTHFVKTVFDNLIRHRVQHRTPTFFSTNFTKQELAGTYGESVMSLLEGKVLPVTVAGVDHRKTVLKKEIQDIINA